MRDIRKYITLIESNEKKVNVVESFKDAKTKFTQDAVGKTSNNSNNCTTL